MSTSALWTFAILFVVAGSAMIGYAIKILHDAYGTRSG